MKILYSNHIPFKGFSAINIVGIVIARKQNLPLDNQTLNHESIHTSQIVELFIIGFYIWYIFEWIIKFIIYKNKYDAYRNIGFEREAYENDINMHFLKKRKRYSFIRYL